MYYTLQVLGGALGGVVDRRIQVSDRENWWQGYMSGWSY